MLSQKGAADRVKFLLWAERGRKAAQKAEEVLDNALKLAPDRAEVLGNVANLKKQMGDMPGAEAHYRRLLEQMPGSTRAWQELSLVKRFRNTDPDIQTIQNLLKSRHLNADGPEHQATICH